MSNPYNLPVLSSDELRQRVIELRREVDRCGWPIKTEDPKSASYRLVMERIRQCELEVGRIFREMENRMIGHRLW